MATRQGSKYQPRREFIGSKALPVIQHKVHTSSCLNGHATNLQPIVAENSCQTRCSCLIRRSQSLLTVQVFPLEICNQAKVKTGFFSEEKVVWADDNNNTCLARSWWWCCGTSSCCLVPSTNTVEILKALNCGRAVNIMQKQNQFARRPVRRWGGVGQFFENQTPESRYSFVLF